LGLEYDGSSFSGFQKQATAERTIQAYLEKALGRVADEAVSVVCAGRTDAGVHASEQVVHFDTEAHRPDKAWVKGVNTYLPDEICIKWTKQVPPSFHARFSAVERSYCYVLYSSPTRPAAMHRHVTWTSYCLDVELMHRGAQFLVGEHDFTSLRASQCQANNPVRDIRRLQVVERGPFIVLHIQANAFLHHMVRNIVGVLLDVGRGARAPEWVGELLEARDRSAGPATAAPSGLYLSKVEYPVIFDLPQRPEGPLFLQV